MTNTRKILTLSTALGKEIIANLSDGIIFTYGSGPSIYFDKLRFNDEVEVVYCYKISVCCGSFEVLPQEYLKLKEEAKALNLIT